MLEKVSTKVFDQFSIRISKRAKYMRLTLSLEKGLVVVIPQSMTKYQVSTMVPDFITQQQKWITHTLKKLQANKQLRPNVEQCLLPKKIALIALQQTFSIEYIHLLNMSLVLEYKENYHLIISGHIDNKKAVFNLLEHFFKQYARPYLQESLDQLSDDLGLPYNRLTVRAQKTRWGSCSSKKNINLNYKLIFLDKLLMDYVLIHELLHTIHMNHSKAYWTDLQVIMPQARRIDKQLNQAVRTLPCWI